MDRRTREHEFEVKVWKFVGGFMALLFVWVITILAMPGVMTKVNHSFERIFTIYEIAPFLMGAWVGKRGKTDERPFKIFFESAPFRVNCAFGAYVLLALSFGVVALWTFFTVMANLRVEERVFSHGTLGLLIATLVTGFLCWFFKFPINRRKRLFFQDNPSASGA